MYYIFDENGNCVCSCNGKPDETDLDTRNEKAVYSEKNYLITDIQLAANKIIEKTATIEELKASKLAEVNAWTAAKIKGGFVSNASGAPVTYDSDVDTQITMSRIRANCENQRFAKLYPDGAPIRGYAQGSDVKQIYMLNAAQIIEWDEDLGVHIGNCKVAGWEKKAEVEAATSKEQLDAIVLD